jgi:hypothetical protein
MTIIAVVVVAAEVVLRLLNEAIFHKIILPRVLVTIAGFGLVIGFIIHLQIVTTSNHNIIAGFHFTNHSTQIFSVYFH